jgi:opacity protein-like surface antigen
MLLIAIMTIASLGLHHQAQALSPVHPYVFIQGTAEEFKHDISSNSSFNGTALLAGTQRLDKKNSYKVGLGLELLSFLAVEASLLPPNTYYYQTFNVGNSQIREYSYENKSVPMISGLLKLPLGPVKLFGKINALYSQTDGTEVSVAGRPVFTYPNKQTQIKFGSGFGAEVSLLKGMSVRVDVDYLPVFTDQLGYKVERSTVNAGFSYKF